MTIVRYIPKKQKQKRKPTPTLKEAIADNTEPVIYFGRRATSECSHCSNLLRYAITYDKNWASSP